MSEMDFTSTPDADTAITSEDLLGSLSIRPDNEGDEGYIHSTWLRFYRRYARFSFGMEPATYFEYHDEVIHRILDHPDTVVKVACFKEAPEVILGYLVIQLNPTTHPPILQFALVKKEYQRKGIFRTLLQSEGYDLTDPIVYTHHTFPMDELVKKFNNLKYIPYLMMCV